MAVRHRSAPAVSSRGSSRAATTPDVLAEASTSGSAVMVVRRIQAWHADNVNVDAKIPALATYLGHVEVRDVYWYLSAVPELLALAAERRRTGPGVRP